VWCTAIRLGGQDEWDYAWKHSLRSGQWTDRRAVLASLACSTSSKNLKSLLMRVFHPDDGLTPAETVAVLSAMNGNPRGRRPASRFLVNNWKRINDR